MREYWSARTSQGLRQKASGTEDKGFRSEITGGQHLNAFTELLCETVRAAGFGDDEIRFKTGVELPGYFRPLKKWDVVVIRGNRLCAAVEMKSHVGPSFGNNFNNRAEEAVGSSTDFWVAFREGALGAQQPWLGYQLLVEDTERSNSTVKLAKTVFPAMADFQNTSYLRRYEIMCRRLMLERKYSAAWLLASPRGKRGRYSEPSPDATAGLFLRSLFGHLAGIEAAR